MDDHGQSAITGSGNRERVRLGSCDEHGCLIPAEEATRLGGHEHDDVACDDAGDAGCVRRQRNDIDVIAGMQESTDGTARKGERYSNQASRHDGSTVSVNGDRRRPSAHADNKDGKGCEQCGAQSTVLTHDAWQLKLRQAETGRGR